MAKKAIIKKEKKTLAESITKTSWAWLKGLGKGKKKGTKETLKVTDAQGASINQIIRKSKWTNCVSQARTIKANIKEENRIKAKTRSEAIIKQGHPCIRKENDKERWRFVNKVIIIRFLTNSKGIKGQGYHSSNSKACLYRAINLRAAFTESHFICCIINQQAPKDGSHPQVSWSVYKLKWHNSDIVSSWFMASVSFSMRKKSLPVPNTFGLWEMRSMWEHCMHLWGCGLLDGWNINKDLCLTRRGIRKWNSLNIKG